MSSSNVKGKSQARSRTSAFGNSASSATEQSGPTATSLPWVTSPVPYQPHLGQKRAIKFLVEHANAGLFADPGTGKTSSVYAAFKILKKKGLASRMLVVAPLRPVSLVWPKERDKWSDFRDLRVAILHGKDKEKALASDADVYVINYEGLPWLLGATSVASFGGKRRNVSVDLKRFRSFNFDTLVLDELSRCKSVNTVTFKSIKQVLPTFQRRWGLTGSPASNGLQDLFGQCYCLDMGRALGQYITHYRNEFFNPHPSGFGFKIRPGAEPLIYKRVAPLVLRLKASDFIDMPELIENRIMFDLPDDVRKIYDAVEEEMFSEIDAGRVVAANAAAASSKCLQIASGGVYIEDDAPDDKKRWQNLHTMKVDLLYDLVEELQGSPILVAYHWWHDLDRLLMKFGKGTPYVGGGTSPKRALELEAAWNAGEIPLLFGHPQSIGHGLNLQGAGNTVAWHSPTWNLELSEQFVGRVHRQGQKEKRVIVHTIMARDTVEEAVWYAVHNKAKTQNGLLDALKATRRK